MRDVVLAGGLSGHGQVNGGFDKPGLTLAPPFPYLEDEKNRPP